MPRISVQAARERRANIMNAARRCFAHSGIHISVDEICAEAGVSKGALYGYFPSKEAVIQAIADEHSADLSTLRDSADAASLSAGLLERIGERENCRMELEAWAYALNKDELRRRFLANIDDLVGALTIAIGRIRGGSGSTASKEASQDAELIETFAMGLLARAALGDEVEIEAILARLVSAIA
jgi:AcrR family transcriptional regulator